MGSRAAQLDVTLYDPERTRSRFGMLIYCKGATFTLYFTVTN